MVFKNDKGDSLVFNLRFSFNKRTDTFERVLKIKNPKEVCKADIVQTEGILVSLIQKEKDVEKVVFNISGYPYYQYDWFYKKTSSYNYINISVKLPSNGDGLQGYPNLWGERVYDDKVTNPFKKEIVTINGKQMEVIVRSGDEQESAYFTEDKGFVAFKLKNTYGPSWWLLDRLE
jgi:hypothetical protein